MKNIYISIVWNPGTENNLLTKYNIKIFRANLKIFPKRHSAKVMLETTSVLLYTIYIYIKENIVHIVISI